MPAQTSLDILLDAARRRCDGEASRLAEELARARAAEDRLALLERYRHDYEASLRSRAHLGLGVEAWRNYRTFLGQLDAALEAQRAELAARHEAAQARQGAWSAARQRVRSFERLSERRDGEVRRHLERREQAAQDEQARRAAAGADGIG